MGSNIEVGASDIARELTHLVHGLREGETVDVRLCVDDNGWTWCLRTGDVQYDTWHSAYCAANQVDASSDCVAIAQDLIEQVLDQIAEEASHD